MMDWIVCEEVGDEYVPMMLEEMELDGADSRAARDRATSDPRPVAVIGLGMSGLLAAIRLQEAGIPFVVFEKNAGVGGTWWENSYPGARVDVGNHFYCYSFEPSDAWTEFFAQQPELQAYFQRVMEEHGIEPHVSFGVEVTGATLGRGRRVVAVAPRRRTDASRPAPSSAPSVSSTGRCSPTYPATFDGPSFHTARWDHDVDLTGKKVVLVGAGATGFQLAPAIADRVEHLTVIQRTAQWMFPNPNYHAQVGDGVRWALQAPAVLRPLVPLPDLLARLRHRPGRGHRRPGLGAAAPVGQRGQRHHPRDVHRLDRQPGRQRPRAGREGRARLPADRQAHPAGQRQLAARR